MIKKFMIVLLVFLLAIGAVGCGQRRPISQGTGENQSGQTQEEEDTDDETGVPSVNEKIELYSCTYRRPGGWHKGEQQGEGSEDEELPIGATSSAAYLKEGEEFCIDITLIDLEDTVDFIYTVEINGIKYRYSDGVFGNTIRDREEKTVTFSVTLTYDGETNLYQIDNIIIMSDLSIRYYVTISEENKPVELPSRAGNGTAEDPYLVYNAEMFLEMSEYPAGTYFKQMNDIDLSTVDSGEKVQGGIETVLDRWKPMGTEKQPFQSHYDGNNFKITRLSIQRLDSAYAQESFGLFGTAVGSEIKNVILEDYRVEVRYSVTVGALVGFARDCTITNCKLVQGRKENFESGSWSFSNMGGLIGFAYGCEVTDCSVKSDLGLYCEDRGEYPLYGMLGGVVGELRNSVLRNCTFSGSMESGSVAGGIVGRCDTSAIAACSSDAKISASRIAGGLIGQLWRSGLGYSAFTGSISQPLNPQMSLYETAYFGGLVGDAGMAYTEYTQMQGPQKASEIYSCLFAGKILDDSMVGERDVARAGGVCSRSFDCSIADVEIRDALIDGAIGAIFSAEAKDRTYIAERAIVSNVNAKSMIFSISEGVLQDVFAEAYLRLQPEGVTLVEKWTDATMRELIAATLSEDVWTFTQGAPHLKYTADVPQEILQEILADWQVRFGE